jgi:hypothetical protein
MALVTKNFSDIITFTRASTATFFDSDGVLTSAATNDPRFDYNPSTLAAQGLLIEEARTNLSTNSVLASAWGAASNASYVNTQALSPDGTNTAWSLVENSANASHFGSMVSILTTYTSGITYTISRFLKASGRNVVTVYLPATNFATPGRVAFFNLTTGVVVSTEAGVTATIQNVGNGWYRCSASAVAIATGSGHVGGSALTDNGTEVYQGNGVSGALVWGHQLEAGAFPTSYIPTTTTALTRAADDARVDVLSPWYNQSAGTLFVERIRGPLDAALARRYVNISDGSVSTNAIQNFQSAPGGSATVSYVAGVSDFNPNPIGISAQGAIVKTALAIDNTGKAMCLDGGTVASVATLAPLSGMTTMFIGGNGNLPGNSDTWIRRITYYPRRLSNAELVSITS